ncbi:MAG: substrate-binding periplasmic protein [Promethearchaeota archaeon]
MKREFGIFLIICCIGIGFSAGWAIPTFVLEEKQCPECPECPECPICPEESEPLLDQIISRGELIVGTSADYPPFEYINATEIIGFDIDLIQLIADEIGVNLTIVDISFDGLISACNASTVDMIAAAIVYTESRAGILAASITYLTLSQVVTVKNASSLIIETLNNLTSYTVGVLAGSINELELLDLGMTVGVNLMVYDSADSLFLALDSGAIDAAYVDQPLFFAYNAFYNLKIIFNTPNESLVMWCKYGEPELLYIINKVLSDVYQNGTIYTLIKKWFG